MSENIIDVNMENDSIVVNELVDDSLAVYDESDSLTVYDNSFVQTADDLIAAIQVTKSE